jgi:hypothetical protein
MSELSALVFNVHRLSTDGGPGLRDTFFLKGCPLRCAWCHLPSQAMQLLRYHSFGMRHCRFPSRFTFTMLTKAASLSGAS